jgi:hypothetical protein
METRPVDVGNLRLWQGEHSASFSRVHAYGVLDQPTHFQVVQALSPPVPWLAEAAAHSDRNPLEFEFHGNVRTWRGRGRVQYRSGNFVHLQPVGSLEMVEGKRRP